MEARLPLSALSSQALVAFIIEFDNEFEHRVPHRTTRPPSGLPTAPWLVSMAMWSKFMRFVPPDGIAVEDLDRIAECSDKNEFRMLLKRLSRGWGYVWLESGTAGSGQLVRPSPGGRIALEAWQPLTLVIEKRWQKRFGEQTIERLRESLQLLAEKLSPDLPDSLPILGYELLSRAPQKKRTAPAHDDRPDVSSPAVSEPTLPALLSKLLLAFAGEFERDSGLSLAVSANVLRVIGDEGVRVRDLPRLSGISREAVAISLRRLEEQGLAKLSSQLAAGRGKTAILPPQGQAARQKYCGLVRQIEESWRTRFGQETMSMVRLSLEQLVGEDPGQSLLFECFKLYPDGWRASLPRPEVLPHYPMVLHRGGFPDGS